MIKAEVVAVISDIQNLIKHRQHVNRINAESIQTDPKLYFILFKTKSITEFMQIYDDKAG